MESLPWKTVKTFAITPQISKDKNRLLKVCCVPATSASLPRLFLLRPLTVLMKQTRQAVRAIKQSILLGCLWLPCGLTYLDHLGRYYTNWNKPNCVHRHQSNIVCLTAQSTCLVCFINSVNGHSKKKKKKGKKCGTSSRHITNLNQSIFSFDIYDWVPLPKEARASRS